MKEECYQSNSEHCDMWLRNCLAKSKCFLPWIICQFTHKKVFVNFNLFLQLCVCARYFAKRLSQLLAHFVSLSDFVIGTTVKVTVTDQSSLMPDNIQVLFCLARDLQINYYYFKGDIISATLYKFLHRIRLIVFGWRQFFNYFIKAGR